MLQGSMVALVTPMQEDGELDRESLNKLVDWHINEGTDAIVAVGTTGESATLNKEEHCRVIRWVVEQAAGRIPVIAGTGSNATAEAIDLTECAKQAGADACLLVTPYYNKPTQEGLYLHFKAIAEKIDIPQFLYNVPNRTACDMLPETVARLAAIDNIVGIKEATGDMTRVTRMRASCAADFRILSGDDATAGALIEAGGNGVISVTANVAPAAMRAMCAAAIRGEFEQARSIDAKLEALHSKLFLQANPIPVKWALYRMGKIGTGIRLPMTVLSQDFHSSVEDALRLAGVLA